MQYKTILNLTNRSIWPLHGILTQDESGLGINSNEEVIPYWSLTIGCSFVAYSEHQKNIEYFSEDEHNAINILVL